MSLEYVFYLLTKVLVIVCPSIQFHWNVPTPIRLLFISFYLYLTLTPSLSPFRVIYSFFWNWWMFRCSEVSYQSFIYVTTKPSSSEGLICRWRFHNKVYPNHLIFLLLKSISLLCVGVFSLPLFLSLFRLFGLLNHLSTSNFWQRPFGLKNFFIKFVSRKRYFGVIFHFHELLCMDFLHFLKLSNTIILQAERWCCNNFFFISSSLNCVNATANERASRSSHLFTVTVKFHLVLSKHH